MGILDLSLFVLPFLLFEYVFNPLAQPLWLFPALAVPSPVMILEKLLDLPHYSLELAVARVEGGEHMVMLLL